ncbi:UNVERIFIED_CONTAM: hypothetical protein H355_003367 [Colinus virginianus]|nr:hypothetical protein H355_003367 [Colinus virginianus]
MVVVRVADRNDNEPRFMQDVFTFYVKENLQPNSPVGMVTVMDFDKGHNAELSLSIQPSEHDQATGIFSIENDTGTIYSTVSFDREQQTSYTFKVKAVDGVATVVATDADTGLNADLNYSIVGGNPFKLFEIDPASGVVSLVGKLAPKHYGLHRLIVQVARSLHTPLAQDIAGDPSYELSKQRLSIVIGVVAGIMTVILLILVVQHDKAKKPKKDKKGKKGKQPLYSSIVTVEASKPNGQRYDSVNEKLSDSPGMGRYRSLHPQSPTAGKKHQAVQDLPPANTFVGAGDNISIGSDHCSEYSCQAGSKYSKQCKLMACKQVYFTEISHNDYEMSMLMTPFRRIGLEEE